MATFERDLQKLLNFEKLGKEVQVHLKRVYGCLAVSMIAAAVGSYVYLQFFKLGFLSVFVSLGFMLALHCTPHTAANFGKRMALLVSFAFFTGMGLGPLLDMAIRIEPSIIPTAFLATSMVFICFSLASLYADDRKFLYLGGTLMSGLSMLLMLSLMNIFLGSQLLFQVNLYVGLVIMCGFVLYDTQLIVEKRKMGDTDFIWHCVDLFIDFINIFRRLLIILSQKEDNKKRKN